MSPEHIFRLNKQAYLLGYAQVHAEVLAKSAQMGIEPTLRFSPGRAVLGGLAGAGVGAAGDQVSGLSGYERALALGGPALAGALLGGFTQESDRSLEERLLERQLEQQKNESMDTYKAQLAGGDLAQ